MYTGTVSGPQKKDRETSWRWILIYTVDVGLSVRLGIESLTVVNYKGYQFMTW